MPSVIGSTGPTPECDPPAQQCRALCVVVVRVQGQRWLGVDPEVEGREIWKVEFRVHPELELCFAELLGHSDVPRLPVTSMRVSW